MRVFGCTSKVKMADETRVGSMKPVVPRLCAKAPWVPHQLAELLGMLEIFDKHHETYLTSDRCNCWVYIVLHFNVRSLHFLLCIISLRN